MELSVIMPVYNKRATIREILQRVRAVSLNGISYTGREFDEGNKISWRNGFTEMWTLLKYRFVD